MTCILKNIIVFKYFFTTLIHNFQLIPVYLLIVIVIGTLKYIKNVTSQIIKDEYTKNLIKKNLIM